MPPANESTTPLGKSLSKTSADNAFSILNCTGVMAESSQTVTLVLPESNVIFDFGATCIKPPTLSEVQFSGCSVVIV